MRYSTIGNLSERRRFFKITAILQHHFLERRQLIMKKIKTARLVIMSLFCVMVLSACASAPVAKYKVLHDSSQTLLTGMSETYTRIGKLQTSFVIISAPNKPIDINTFKPVIEGQSFDITPSLQYREDAFEVLVRYLNVLNVLASKDYASDIDKASIELSASIKTLIEETNVAGADNAAQVTAIFGTAIDTLSRPIVETKRIDALKSIMDSSQEDLQTLASLLTGSNTKIKAFIVLARKSIIDHANAARPLFASLYRYEYDQHIADLLEEIEEILAAIDTIDKGIEKIPAAHKEIRASLDEEQSGIEALKSLVQEARRVNKFYRSLAKKK